jgi:hypothetical protein
MMCHQITNKLYLSILYSLFIYFGDFEVYRIIEYPFDLLLYEIDKVCKLIL